MKLKTLLYIFLALLVLPLILALALLGSGFYFFPHESPPSTITSKNVVDAYWIGAGGKGEPSKSTASILVATSPIRELLFGVSIENDPLFHLSWRVASMQLQRKYIRPSKTVWNLGGFAGQMLVAWQWTPAEIATYLSKYEWFALEPVGLDNAAMVYFAKPTAELSATQLLFLLTVGRRPRIDEVWCHPEILMASAKRHFSDYFSSVYSLRDLGVLPRPAGVSCI